MCTRKSRTDYKERERERERETETETERQRETETETETDRGRQTDTKTGRQINAHCETVRQTDTALLGGSVKLVCPL